MTGLPAMLVLTVLSGIADGSGFVHASRIWHEGSLNGREVALSGGSFAAGIACFWLALRFAQGVGIVSAEAQTLGWFVATIIGVAVLSGEARRWPPLDQGLAVLAACSIGALLYRTG